MGLRGAIVGYGFIASQGHLPTYLRRREAGPGSVDIVAVADLCEARRDACAHKLKGVRTYADWRTLLDREAEKLDFIDIATPPAFHSEIAGAALDAGCHVLCEKPLTTSAVDAAMLLGKAVKAQRVLFPCHNYCHAPVIKAVRQVICDKRIGAITSVAAKVFRNTHAKGVPEWKPDWRRHREFSGGGICMDHGSHTFYLCFDWLNSFPNAVTAKCTAQQASYDTEDNFNGVITFPAGWASVSLSWTAGIRKTIYIIQGESGAVTVEDDDVHVALLTGKERPNGNYGEVQWTHERQSVASNWMDASHWQWFEALFDEFCSAIEQQAFAGRRAQDALMCIRLIEACYDSARQSCREVPIGHAGEVRA